MDIEKVEKRNGDLVDFDRGKIERVLRRAFLDVYINGHDDIEDNIVTLTDSIIDRLEDLDKDTVNVETIQDIVEETLMLEDYVKVAKEYIIYREFRRKSRGKRNQGKSFLDEEFLSDYKHQPNPFPTELGEFIYYRTYSRWLPDEQRREYWWETVKRAVEYNCSLAPTTKEEAEKLFDNIYHFKNFLAGRTLWTGGTKASKKYPMSNYNCFTRDTEFVTDGGIKSFEDFEDGDKVNILDGYSVFSEATVKNFGEKDIYELVVNKDKAEKTYRVTDDHIWFVRKTPKEKKYKEVATKELKTGDVLREKKVFREKNTPNICNIGIQHGIVFGDGTYDKKKNHCRISLIGEKQELLEYFTTGTTCTEGDRDSTLVYGLPYDWKEMPSIEANPEYILGFIVGYIATDGSVNTSVKIASSSKENLEKLKDLAITVGIKSYDIKNGRRTNNNYGDNELYELTFDKADITSLMILRSRHQEVFNEYNLDRAWKVKRVTNLNIKEETWCVTGSRTESFTLDSGIHTHNCAFTVVDSFKSYEDLFYLLMVGAGVGVRVLPEDVEKLAPIRTDLEIKHEYYNALPKEEREELTSYFFEEEDTVVIRVGDSKEAWVQALKIYLEVLYRHEFKIVDNILFNYDSVRPKGERLKTFGGHASGHQSVKRMFDKIDKLLKKKNDRKVKLSPLDCLDIANIIGENVVSGGVRRTSEIGLFSVDDEEVKSAKNELYKQENGEWVINKEIEHRQLSNNSIFYEEKPSREQLNWHVKQMRYSGEPGFINAEEGRRRRDNFQGVNPCFTGDTKVRMDNTSYKEIKDIKKGDYVKSYNHYKGIMENKRVIASEKTREDAEVVKLILDNGKEIKCTPGHDFYDVINSEYTSPYEGMFIFENCTSNNYELPGVSDDIIEFAGEFTRIKNRTSKVPKSVDLSLYRKKSGFSKFMSNSNVKIKWLYNDLFNKYSHISEELQSLYDKGYGLKLLAQIIGLEYNDFQNRIISGLSLSIERGRNVVRDRTKNIRSSNLKSKNIESSRLISYFRSLVNDDYFKTNKSSKIFNRPSYGNFTIVEYEDDYYYSRSHSELIALIYYLRNNQLLELEPVLSDGSVADFKLKDGTIIDIKDEYSISNKERVSYLESLGVEIIGPNKIDQYKSHLELPTDIKSCNYYKVDTNQSFLIRKIESIERIDNQDVYDITVEDNHNFFAEDVLVHNCAEILLDSNGMCNLVSLNVKAFVDEDGNLDREGLLDAQRMNVRSAYRMALVDFELPDWDFVNKRDRLIGLSLTGWQDAMNKLGWNNTEINFTEGDYDISEISEHFRSTDGYKNQKELLNDLRDVAKKEARKYSNLVGDEEPVLVTTVKPEGCITKDHIRVTDQGLLFIDELDDNIEKYNEDEFVDISGYSRDGNDINKVYNNGKSDIVRLTLKNGRKIDLTYNHPLSINGDWIEAKDIDVNDVIDYELGQYNNERHSLLENVDVSEFRKGDNGMLDYNIPSKMNEDLAWLVGAYLANGSFPIDKDRKNQNRIKFHCEYKDVHEKVKRIWKDLFDVDTKIVKSSDRNSYTQDFASVKIRKWFRINGLDKPSNDFVEKIPLKIRKSSKNDVISFIVGYADNDGCFHSKSFCIDSSDKKLIRNIQEVGEAVGLSFSYTENKERTGYSDIIYKNHMSRVYTDEEVIDYINKISVKAKKRPLVNSDGYRYVQNPYKVVKKEILEDRKTYGIQVENEHWYYQGGLKSHNTQTQMPTVSSGLHYNHSPYYIRRVRINAEDPLVSVAEDLNWNVKNDVGQDSEEEVTRKVLEFPVKAPEGLVKKDVSAIEQLETYKMFMDNYVEHNASITVHVRDDEWDDVEEWLWQNWDAVVGISFLLYNDSFYDLMPYEETDEETYKKMVEEMDTFKPHLVNKYEKGKKERELEQDGCESGVCPVR